MLALERSYRLIRLCVNPAQICNQPKYNHNKGKIIKAATRKLIIGRANEYPTMHYFGNPR